MPRKKPAATRRHPTSARHSRTRRPEARRVPAPAIAAVLPPSLQDDVRALNRRFTLGLFDSALFEAAESLLRRLGEDESGLDPVRLKARSTIAEIMDQQGRRELSRQAVQAGGRLFEGLKSEFGVLPDDGTPVAQHAQVLVKEQIRFVAEFARMHLYRGHQFQAARAHLEFCAQLTQRRLRQNDFRCHGTLGLIYYYMGCAERQMGRLDDADRCYGRAIAEYSARADEAAHLADLNRREEELALARHNTAVILGLGLAWTNSQRGLLRRSLDANVLPAQVLLLSSEDQTNKAYLALLRGAIERSLAGGAGGADLAIARASIERAHAVFTTPPYRHVAYAIRASYELALCAVAAGDYSSATTLVNRMEDEARSIGDDRWRANAFVVRSRICRHQERGSEALEHAREAQRLMSGKEEVLGQIDALVATAEAQLLLKQAEDAASALADALRILEARGPNQKIEAVLRLLMARCRLRTGDVVEAERCFEHWNRIKDRVEHALVHELASAVSHELTSLRRDFRVPWDVAGLGYKEHDKQFRAWLIFRAEREPGVKTRAQVANRLGIKRPTLNTWENDATIRSHLTALRRNSTA